MFRRAVCQPRERLNPRRFRPDKTVQDVAFRESRVAGETNYGPVVIDRSGCIPKLRAKVTQICHAAFLPKDLVFGSVAPNRLVADAGNADRLARIVDRHRCAGGIVRSEERKLADLIAGFKVPVDGTALLDLLRDAGAILTSVLRPANRLTVIVHPSGEAVNAASRWPAPHLPSLPA